MKAVCVFFTLFFLPALAVSEPEANPQGPASAAENQAITYELRELKPAGITQYSSAGESVVRQYFEFKNEQGSHNIIYEEIAGAAPLRTVTSLREIARAWESSCAIDIECASKAFCTGDCRSMYYEVANAPGDAYAPDRNKCKIQYFSCEKQKAPAIPPAASPGKSLVEGQ